MARLLYRALLARYMNIIQKVYIWWRIVAFLGVKLYHWMAYPFKSHASKYHNYEFGRQDPPLYIPRTNHCSVGTSPLSLLLWNYNYRHYQPAKSSGFALMQLPLEIRLMIWKFCIGGKTLHLMSRKNKHLSYRHLTHIACKEHMNFNGDSCRMLCRNYLRQLAFPEDLHCRRDFWVREFKIYGPGLLHLPMTCRQIYRESIEILYTDNLFLVQQPYLTDFSVIFRNRFDLITSFRLLWGCQVHFSTSLLSDSSHIDHHELKWLDTWHILASMKNLKYLWVDLVCPDFKELRVSEAEQEVLMKSIMKITAPQKFVLRLPLVTEKMAFALWEQLPCKLVYGDGPDEGSDDL